MEENKKHTLEEKVDDIHRRMKIVLLENHIQTVAVILAFIGVVSIYDIFKKKK
jgi:hypothetical protein